MPISPFEVFGCRTKGGDSNAFVFTGNVAGGVESLIEHRASIERQGSPVAKNLLRRFVGAELVDELIEGLQQALNVVTG